MAKACKDVFPAPLSPIRHTFTDCLGRGRWGKGKNEKKKREKKKKGGGMRTIEADISSSSFAGELLSFSPATKGENENKKEREEKGRDREQTEIKSHSKNLSFLCFWEQNNT